MKTISAFIEHISRLCWSSPKYRHLLFFILTFVILCTYGYYFGTFDQASHIPFLKKTVDATLFPNDHFFDLRISHYSYFWLLFVPFYKIHVLELSMFFAYIITTYFTFWALWKLAKTLFLNPVTAFLATVAGAFPHIGFSGFPLFEFSLLNRTAVLPFELIALNFYLKKDYKWAFIILGILYNFHALSVHFILAMIGVDILFHLIKKRGFHALLATPFFLVTALPVLIWKFRSSGIQTGIQWDWFHILNSSTFFHLFNFISFKNLTVDFLTLGGVSSLILFFIAKKHIPKNELHETVAHFIYGGIFVLLIQFFATCFLPITIVIQAQVMRIGIFLSLFAYLYMTHYINLFRRTKAHFICFVASLFLSFTPFILLLTLLFWRTTQTKIMKGIMAFLVLIFFITLTLAISLNLARPGIHIWPEKTAFYDVQVWARENTPKNALFLTPPAKWWFYDVEWRVISERSTVSTLSELLEGAFDPTYISYWKPRFEDIAPGALKQFQGDYLKNAAITDETYYSHSTNEFVALGKKYTASYLVVDRKYIYSLPIAYQNKEYTVYSLTHQSYE